MAAFCIRIRTGLLLALFLAAGSASAQVVNDTFRVFTVHTPPEIARVDTILGQVPDWGGQPPPGGITAPLVLALDSLSNPSTACLPELVANPEALAGAIALVERGLCEFGSKAQAVQDLGAVAFLVAQDGRVPDSDCETVVAMYTPASNVTIPGGFLPRCVAVALYPTLLAGTPVTATLAPFFVSVATEPGAEEPRPLTLAVAPNPAAGPAVVTLTLAEAARVRVAVYDVLGREVVRLAEGLHPAGAHRLALDASALTPGVYVVRAEAGPASVAERVVVVR